MTHCSAPAGITDAPASGGAAWAGAHGRIGARDTADRRPDDPSLPLAALRRSPTTRSVRSARDATRVPSGSGGRRPGPASTRGSAYQERRHDIATRPGSRARDRPFVALGAECIRDRSTRCSGAMHRRARCPALNSSATNELRGVDRQLRHEDAWKTSAPSVAGSV